MTYSTLEKRVRDYVAERADVPIPSAMRSDILRMIASSQPRPVAPRLQLLRVAALVAALLLLAIGVAWIRIVGETIPTPAGTVHGNWSSAAGLPMGRAFHTATTLPNGEVIVVGGLAGYASNQIPTTVELFNPAANSWTPASSLTIRPFWQTATLLTNGRVLIVGGVHLASSSFELGSSETELYNPMTNTWSLAASMLTPRVQHTATLLADGRVLVVGGTARYWNPGSPGGTALTSVERYDPATNTWATAAPLLIGRAMHSAILLADHRVLVVGGADTAYLNAINGMSLRSVELYDPATNTWSARASMQFSRVLPTLNLLPDGRVLVVGDVGGNELTAEIYDPRRDTWSPAPSPGGLRAGHVAVSLHGGNVLVVGGAGEASAQIYDWRRNIWLNAGHMATAREGAAAAVLKSGQVLVTGGFGPPTTALPSAELYDPGGATGRLGDLPAGASMSLSVGIFVLAFGLPLVGFAVWALRRRSGSRTGKDDWVQTDA